MVREDLSDVVVGDKIAIVQRDEVYIATVARVTKTLLITERGSRFYKAGGEQTGQTSGWKTIWACKPTAELVNTARRQALVRRGKKIVWERLGNIDNDNLKLIIETLELGTTDDAKK